MMKLAAALLAAIVLAGCTRPTDVVVPEIAAQWNERLGDAMSKLPSDDAATLVRYLERARSGQIVDSQGLQGVAPGTTIGQAIAAQRNFERLEAQRGRELAQAKVLPPAPGPTPAPAATSKPATEATQARPAVPAEPTEYEQAVARAVLKGFDESRRRRDEAAKCEADAPELARAVSVEMFARRQLIPSVDSSVIFFSEEYVFAVRNNSEMTVVGIAGALEFIDVFGETVGSIKMQLTDTIAPQSRLAWTSKRNLPHGPDPIWELKDGKFKVRLVPEKVAFEGGRVLKRC